MRWFGMVVAGALIFVIFIDAFEAVILPRRVRHGYRLARSFYRSTWFLWRTAAKLLPVGRWRNAFLGLFGPLSLLGLLAIWASGLIVGFALLHLSLETSFAFAHEADYSLAGYLYFSGTTFFTLGYGDVVPIGVWGRALSVTEAGIGFGFLAVIISYLPVLYQAFSRREIAISLLDARAGSPPTAAEYLRRLADAGSLSSTGAILVEWERWSAELLETHISFPVLRYYRSQHDNQSWVAALTFVLDTSALLIACVENAVGHQARLTFAMARHAAVDLCLISDLPLLASANDRLPQDRFAGLHEQLQGGGPVIRDAAAAAHAFAELRRLYEPFVNALAAHFMFALPAIQPDKAPIDNWQTSPGMQRSPGLDDLPSGADDHFD